MKLLVATACALLLIVGSAPSQSQQGQQTSSAKPVAFDPSIPLVSRITSPPDMVQQQLSGLKPSPTLHKLTEEEQAQVESVLRDLPPFTHEIFR